MATRTRAALGAAALLLTVAGSAWATDTHISLACNWNGLLHPGEAGIPDDPNGFRSIADRALYVDALNPNSIGAISVVGSTGISYSVPGIPGTLDCVHLGNTFTFTPTTPTGGPPAGNPTRWWDGSGNPGLNVSHGVQPAWLIGVSDHLQPQTTNVAALGLVMDQYTSIGFLYNISNGGGTFQVVLGFTDASTVTVTLGGNDWAGATNPPAPSAGVASQTRLGGTTFAGSDTTDSGNLPTFPTGQLSVTEAVITNQSLVAAGLGNIVGKTLSTLTFQNVNQPNRGYAIYAATVVNGLPPPANDLCSNPTPVFAGSTLSDNLRATGAATSPCGTGDTTDVWYSFTSPVTGIVEARTCGAAFDTSLAVYTSCAGGAFACNDNGCGIASRLQWSASLNQTYLIRVAGNNASTGSFTLVIDTAPPVHTDAAIPLLKNWNGIVHSGESGVPDEPGGFRSISDRALHASGTTGSINGGGLIGTDFIPYSIEPNAGTLDLVHLGLTGVGSPRQWDAVANGDNRGIQPTWLTNIDHRSPQVTPLAAMNVAMGPNTRIGLLYHVSNGGGTFDMTLRFADNSSATVTLQAPDWYQSQTPAAPGAGVEVQRQLGLYSATSNQDTATLGAPSLNVVEAVISTSSLASGGLGSHSGKRLTSLTFSNPVSGTASGFAIYAATLRDAVPNNDPVPPSGAGGASPNPAEATRSVLLTVATTPGFNPVSTGLAVTANLQAIGGLATQPFFDNASNGDAVAGDGVFSFRLNVPANQAVGPYSLPFTVSDAQSRSTNGSIALNVVGYAWNEQVDGLSDAGELTATRQRPTGVGALGAIVGDMPANDADVYLIRICNVAEFSATTLGVTTFDTQLFLFRPDGTGVVLNDDAPNGGGALQSTISNTLVTQPGLYLLGITRYDRDPIDASAQALWLDNPFNTERAPDGPGAANPFTAWTGATIASGAYRINLTGVCFPGCAADVDGNGAIEPSDIAVFVNLWLNSLTGGGLAGDFDGNGAVEPSDIAAFVNAWLNALTNGC